MTDSLVQLAIFGFAINLAAGTLSFYFWTKNRAEHYLLFWALCWGTGVIRWAIHVPAQQNGVLLNIEGLVISAGMFFNVLGCYDLLPQKPWRYRSVTWSTVTIMLLYGVVANVIGRPIEMGYALFAATLAFDFVCLSVAYRAARLTGYAFAAATFLYQFVMVVALLLNFGRAVSNTIIVPLFNIPLVLCIAVIAHQRERRLLVESERVLLKIFDTAPTPIVITRPPGGEIERANALAFEMLGLLPSSAVGRTAVEQGVVVDSEGRERLYSELEAGRPVTGHVIVINRAGTKRTLSVNADRLELEGGPRYIFSFYDLTDLQRAEDELRAAADEMRQLYTRLARVEDDERRALHAELHDQVGANLAALRLELDVAMSLLARDDSANAQRHLVSARDAATETIALARDLMAELRPPALDDYGLVAALRTFAESQSERLSLSIGVAGQDLSPRPGPLVEGALFRIAQEAVSNAARHASASRVTVDVTTCEGQVQLRVADDGVGFDPTASAAGPDHWGLKNMRERARAVGGVLRVDSAPGAGTRITVEAPREAS